jgi:hypothetical protein
VSLVVSEYAAALIKLTVGGTEHRRPGTDAHLCGQVVFINGGSDAVIRGDATS